MSQAAKEVTAGWNFKAFILIRMGLHACNIYSSYSKKKFKKKKFVFKARWLTLPHIPYMGRVCPVPFRKTRIVQSSNSKQIFSLALRPETKCHISRLFLWKKLSQCGRARAAYARTGYSIIKMKKKRKNISLFKLKKKIEFFSLALRQETKFHISRFSSEKN